MNSIKMPGFTADSSLSIPGQGYRIAPWQQGGPLNSPSDIRLALINNGSGGGSNFWCDETNGTCSCLGGWLSDDCWLMGQYCTTGLDCSPYFPYKCTCSYLLTRPTRPIFPPPRFGGVFTR